MMSLPILTEYYVCFRMRVSVGTVHVFVSIVKTTRRIKTISYVTVREKHVVGLPYLITAIWCYCVGQYFCRNQNCHLDDISWRPHEKSIRICAICAVLLLKGCNMNAPPLTKAGSSSTRCKIVSQTHALSIY